MQQGETRERESLKASGYCNNGAYKSYWVGSHLLYDIELNILGDLEVAVAALAEAALVEGAAVKTELIRARETIKHQASSRRECSIENQKIAALVEEAHTAQLHKMTEDCAVRRRSAMHSRKTALQVDTVYLYAMLKKDSLH